MNAPVVLKSRASAEKLPVNGYNSINPLCPAVDVNCVGIANANCVLTPGNTVSPTSTTPVLMTAAVSVPAGAAPGVYPVAIQATTSGAPATVTASFSMTVTFNSDFALTEVTTFPEVNAGSTGTSGPIQITAQDGFSGVVTLNCPATFGANSCSVSPAAVSTFPATATLTINASSFAVGSYSLNITGTSGAVTHSVPVAFNVGDYTISGTQALTLSPGSNGNGAYDATQPADSVRSLQNLKPFRAFSEEECSEILSIVRTRSAPKGEILFGETNPGDACFVIVKGAVDVTFDQHGGEKLTTRLGPSGIFGQLALIDGGGSNGVCTVHQDALLLEMKHDACHQIFACHTPLAYKLLAVLTDGIIDALRGAERQLKRLNGHHRVDLSRQV